MIKVTDQPPGASTEAARAAWAVRSRPCPLCETPAGEPCQPKPAADHLARWLDTYTAGQLTRSYMARVLGELVVIDACAVIAARPELPAAAALAGPDGALPGALGRLLAAGHAITYAEAAGTGGWFADLRDGDGRLVETGLGATQAEAAAHLAKRMGGAR